MLIRLVMLMVVTVQRVAIRLKGLRYRFGGTVPCDDADLTFYLQVFKDRELAEQTLENLREHFPRARVLVTSDGDPDPAFRTFESRFGTEVHYGERLYEVSCGGRMLQRILQQFLARPTRFLVKLDTDTRFDRRFRYLPAGDAVYGTMQTAHGSLQGGCIVFSRSAAERLHASRIFLDSRLIEEPAETWGRYLVRQRMHERVSILKQIGFEWVLLWGCKQIGVASEFFPEVFSAWRVDAWNRRLLANTRMRFAAVHPRKLPVRTSTNVSNG